MIGFGEGLGSGFPLILDAWNEKQWPRPELVEEQDLMQVKLVLKFGINKGNVLKNVLNELSDRQLNIIQFIQKRPDSTWVEMSERLKVSSKTIQRDIKDMQKKRNTISRRWSCRWLLGDSRHRLIMTYNDTVFIESPAPLNVIFATLNGDYRR